MTNTTNVTNLLGMARTAQLGGNQAEALTYFNRVLEIDPKVSEAWQGKGKAAGWLSTLADIRLPETLIAFNHAIATTPDTHKQDITDQVVQEANKIIVALYTMARNQLSEYAALDNTWTSYIDQVAQLIDALEEVRGWAPDDRTTLENIVHLCKDNVEGYSFRNPYNNNMPGLHTVSDSYEGLLRTKLDNAAQSLSAIDPSYSMPRVEKQKADTCFVVTATMGDLDHPDTKLLRRFRDERLLNSPVGRAAVARYYVVGPRLAQIIAGSTLLRIISYRFLVAPAAWYAKRALKG